MPNFINVGGYIMTALQELSIEYDGMLELNNTRVIHMSLVT